MINFHPDNFFQEEYDNLSALDRMRYDTTCCYKYLYERHIIPFDGLPLLTSKILQPREIILTSKNRQICLTEMAYAIRGIVSLFAAHVEVLVSGPFLQERKIIVSDSLEDLADIVNAEIHLFIHARHSKGNYRPDYECEKLILAWRTSYVPENVIEVLFDLVAGLITLHDYILCARSNTPTPIMISYRNDGKGSGALYDHVVFQTITGRDTVILTDGKLELLINKALTNNNQPSLIYGIKELNSAFTRPLYLTDLASEIQNEGMIVIPGLAEIDSNNKNFKMISNQNEIRGNYEKQLVCESLGKRTMLFICGGLYRLCEVIGENIVPVDGHRGSMPRYINQQLVGNNCSHLVIVMPGSKAAKLMGFTEEEEHQLMVTSVHQKAAKEPLRKETYTKYTVTGRASQVDRIHYKNNKFTDSIEIMENNDTSCPTIIGTQFHPESAIGKTIDECRQQQLIINLAKEADLQRVSKVKSIRKDIEYNRFSIFYHLGDDTLGANIEKLEKITITSLQKNAQI